MAPRSSGASRCCVPAWPAAVVASPQALGGGVVAAPREADVELLQLAVQVRALEPRLLGHLAHVALLAAEELFEVEPLERLARLAQRQLEEAGRDLGRDRRRRCGGFAEEALDMFRRDVAAHRAEVRHDAGE